MTLDDLKDHFASQYIAGIGGTSRLQGASVKQEQFAAVAREAYELAEALVEERKRRNQERQERNARGG